MSLQTKRQILNELTLFASDKKSLSQDKVKYLGDIYQVNPDEIKEVGVESFLLTNNILELRDVQMLSFYIENQHKGNDVYDVIKEQFAEFDTSENKKLITLIEVTNVVQEYYRINHGAELSFRCAASIGGAILATAGFAFVPGPGWAMGIALASKVYPAISLMDSCINNLSNSKNKEEEFKKLLEREKEEYEKEEQRRRELEEEIEAMKKSLESEFFFKQN